MVCIIATIFTRMINLTDYSLTILCLDQQVPLLGHTKIAAEKIISVLVIPMMALLRQVQQQTHIKNEP